MPDMRSSLNKTKIISPYCEDIEVKVYDIYHNRFDLMYCGKSQR